MLKFENILKGLISTLGGAALMYYAFNGWYFTKGSEALTDWQALVIGIIGFGLCFVRAKVEEAVSGFIIETPKKLIEKWFGKTSDPK